MTKFTAIYIRTSTSKQEKGHESQLRAINQYCSNKNIQNLQIYEDFGISGTKKNRPGLDQLLTKCRNNEIEHVIVYSFSRFARSIKHLLEALEEFKSLNIRFTSISEDIDSSTAIGRAIFVIISALSTLERDILSERTIIGLKNAKAKGKILGRPKTRNSNLINELIKKGFSQRHIASLVGCSRTTVSREIKSGTQNE